MVEWSIMPAGRPFKYKTSEEIVPLIEAYFSSTAREEWTITGLALALDTSRTTLCDMEGRDELANTVKKAKEMVENSYELDLKKHGRSGTIFALKNFNWKDKNETDLTTGGKPFPILGNVRNNNGNKEDSQSQ